MKLMTLRISFKIFHERQMPGRGTNEDWPHVVTAAM